MKRIISILLTIISVCCITASVTLNALAAITDKIESNLTYTDRYGSWTYELTSNKKGYKITDYDESMSQIQIPSVINNLPVLEIGNRAFSYCSGLYSITIPNSIKTIDNYAFINCTSLTNITLMNGVATIGDQAFRNCSSLTSITIPESVTTIGSSTFEDCNSLASINVSSNNKNYSSIDGVLFNKTQSKLIRYPIKKLSDNYIIPSSVTDIGNRAFYNCDNLISITIPESVTTMGDYVFEICNNLTNITILNGVTNIGLQAFNGCSSLTSITLPNSVKTIGSKAFIGCKNRDCKIKCVSYKNSLHTFCI